MSYLNPGGDLSAVASYCGIRNPTAAQLEDLADDVESAVSAVENPSAAFGGCGPVLSRSVAYRVRTPVASVVTPSRVAEVTSFVGLYGVSLDLDDLDVDGQTVRLLSGARIPPGVLTYASGWTQAEIPPALITAGRMIVRQLWRARLGNQRAEGEPGVGVLIPRQAELLMGPYELTPMGFS